MSALRLFVAVDPPPAVRDALRAMIGPLRPLAPRARWVDPDAIHLTLAFLGERADEEVPPLAEALRGAAAGHAPIAAHFAGGGAFGGKRPRVLWAGITEGAAALAAVHRDVAAALASFGYRPEHAELTPHLTLARAGDRGGDPSLAACVAALAGADFGGGLFAEMVLYQSHLGAGPARYTALAKLPFNGG